LDKRRRGGAICKYGGGKLSDIEEGEFKIKEGHKMALISQTKKTEVVGNRVERKLGRILKNLRGEKEREWARDVKRDKNNSK